MVIFAKFVAFFCGVPLVECTLLPELWWDRGSVDHSTDIFSSHYAQSVVPYLEFLPFVLLVVVMFNKSFPLNAVAFLVVGYVTCLLKITDYVAVARIKLRI